MPIDHRQSTSTSRITSPEDALSQISGLRQQLRQKRDAAGPGNVKLLYGGMAPVPLTFLTGMMIGNEAELTVMDWDRFAEKWRGNSMGRMTVIDLLYLDLTDCKLTQAR